MFQVDDNRSPTVAAPNGVLSRAREQAGRDLMSRVFLRGPIIVNRRVIDIRSTLQFGIPLLLSLGGALAAEPPEDVLPVLFTGRLMGYFRIPDQQTSVGFECRDGLYQESAVPVLREYGGQPAHARDLHQCQPAIQLRVA
jgi:hypothetical protein